MLADAKLDFAPQVMVTQLYDKSLGWQSGGFSDADDEVKFYDFKNEYEYKGDRIQDSFTMFNLAIKLVPPAGGCDGEMNDCLWYCLRSIVNKDVDRLPKALNTQKKLKRFLKVKRLDPVHVDRIPSIEAKMEINREEGGVVRVCQAEGGLRRAGPDHVLRRSVDPQCPGRRVDQSYPRQA